MRKQGLKFRAEKREGVVVKDRARALGTRLWSFTSCAPSLLIKRERVRKERRLGPLNDKLGTMLGRITVFPLHERDRGVER